ncbi:hypothetical protein ACU6U9_08055 [Pseudomonas sp. HK3]
MRTGKKLGAEVVEWAAIIDFPALNGSHKIREAGLDAYSICDFD